MNSNNEKYLSLQYCLSSPISDGNIPHLFHPYTREGQIAESTQTNSPVFETPSYDPQGQRYTNAIIQQACLVTYDPLFCIKKPHIFIQISIPGKFTNIWLFLEERDYKNTRIIEAVGRQLNQAGAINQFCFNPELGKAKCGAHLISEIENILKRFHVDFYGGWDLKNNYFQYTPCRDEYYRSMIQRKYIPEVFISPQPFNPSSGFSNLISTYSYISDCRARLILFLYLHYSITYSMLSSCFSATLPIILNFCLPEDTAKQERIFKSLFVGSSELHTAPIILSDSISEIRKKFLLAKDFPILLRETGTLTSTMLASRSNFIYDLICGNQKIRQRTLYESFDTPIKAVPILFSETVLELDDAVPCLHIVFDQDDLSNLLQTTELNWIQYISYFCLFIRDRIVNYNLQTNTFIAEMDHQKKLLLVFELLYKFVKEYAAASDLNINLDQSFGFDGNISNFLATYIDDSFQMKADYSETFIQSFLGMKSSNRFRIFKLPFEKDPGKCPSRSHLNEACVFVKENSFWLNKKAFEDIVREIPGNPKKVVVLKSLDKQKKLGAKRVNCSSYLNKFNLHLNDGSCEWIYAYELTNISNIENEENIVCDSIVGRQFYFGNSLKRQQAVIWNFDLLKIPNRHMLISGLSGTGKTFFINKAIRQAADQHIPTFYFHIQGDLSPLRETCNIIDLYSKHYSIYAFETRNTDVKKTASEFSVIAKKTLKLSDKQEDLINESAGRYLSVTDRPSLAEYLLWFQDWCDQEKNGGTTTARKFSKLNKENLFSNEPFDWSQKHNKPVVFDLSQYAESSESLKFCDRRDIIDRDRR
ncbi:hypothetical protein SDC9_80098 [bioreactor metagenome]|uniref:Helicase HerA-like C-terminal domain-containing protein n=1 Tax=bioreactor metagenome TaxID=1076179 RepID=A0A644YYH3_9ZZZZ